MCYDIKTKLETQLKRAKRKNNPEWMDELKKKLGPYLDDPLFHATGFSHPTLLIYSNEQPDEPVPSTWGLVPHWVKDENEKIKIWNSTINARGETIFEKPSFKSSALHKRCLIPLDGFYEHHHFKGKTYPFYIYRNDREPLMVGGIWSTWVDKTSGELISTCSIVTTKANALMAKIHNNPKLPEARMPLILDEEMADEWLQPIITQQDKELVQALIKPFPAVKLMAYPVRTLRGKHSLGNVPESAEQFDYEELEWE